jgi:predicted acylesterase/phospholipase RssA
LEEWAAVVVAEPLLEFGGGELARRFDHGVLAVSPPGLDRVQPRALAWQATGQDPAPLLACLDALRRPLRADPLVMGLDPVADRAAGVPGGVVPEQRQDANGVGSEPLAGPGQEGAGALIGLLATCPKGKSPEEALPDTKNFDVHDMIFAFLPVNYKVFHKHGAEPIESLYSKFAQFWLMDNNPLYSKDPENTVQQFLNDWFALIYSTLAPTDVTYFSKGLSSNVPFIEDVIDFDNLSRVRPGFYINAYNINKQKMMSFSKEEITGDHFRASCAFPFIYPPYQLDGDYYYEGAAVDCLNYKSLLEHDTNNEIDRIVVFDIIGAEQLIRVPRNLWDAYIISIIVPLVEIARDDTKIFQSKYNLDRDGKEIRKLMPVTFDIPDEDWPSVLDWSRSNLEKMFDIGYQAGKDFIRTYEKELF